MQHRHNDDALPKGGDKRKIWILIAAALALVTLFAVVALVMSPGNGRTFPVYISEVLASNTRYPNGDGRCCDYVELYNSADYAVDLSGFELGDIGGNQRYVFPSGTVMEPHSYLVVYCDKTVTDGSYGPFGISRAGGENIYLLTTNRAVADSIVTIATDLDQSMVRQADGQLAVSDLVTPGCPNDKEVQIGTAVYNSAVSPVRITEISTANTGYCAEAGALCDWVELFNTSDKTVDISGFILSDNTGNDKFVFPEDTVIPGGGYLVVYCSDSVQENTVASFGLNRSGGEYVVLKTADGRIVELVDTMAVTGSESQILQGETWQVTTISSPGFANTEEGQQSYLDSIGAGRGSVVITEVMASNQAFLADARGEFSDWVELYNTGSESVDLTGWFLSDDPDEPAKWTFSQLVLEPGQYAIVYCSGKDMTIDGQQHTNFSLAASGEGLVLTSYAGVCVDSVSYTEAEENCSFVFAADADAQQTKYPTPGHPNDMDGYEKYCAGAMPAGPLAIWEVMTSNDWYLPQALGVCYDWVELRNISDDTIRLSDYSITDDADIPGQYVLPDRTLAPGESCVIILSGDTALSNGKYDHAGFSLNAAKDQLFVYTTDGALLDYVSLCDIPFGYSYGRGSDVGGFFYMKPTPNTANSQGYRLISAMPTSEIQPGVYATQTSMELPLDAIGDIYYTTDGSVPTTASRRYTGPIQVDKTMVVRAVSVEKGKLNSDIYTSTFIVQEPHDIPVVSLVTDPENLWGSTGIYKYNLEIKEEKRPANLAYEGEDGSFSIDCEISLHGGMTVTAMDKKSFTLRFHDNYAGKLDYDLFEDGEVTSFRSLLLRASHESTYSSHMRDALMGHVASNSSDAMVAQKFKYVALYLNGEYWGLYALREHHSEEHFATYQNVPASSVARPMKYAQGTNSLTEIYQFSLNNSFASEKNYAYAKSLLNLESFADWIIFEAYTGNIDINENMRYYYTAADGKWYCGLVDVDLGMFSFQCFETVTEAFHHNAIPEALMANKEFRAMVAKRLAELLKGPLSDEAMIANIDWMAGIIRNEVAMDCARWGGTSKHWERMVGDLKTFCDGRAERLINSFCSSFHLTDAEKQEYFGDLLK